ncbi:hypothetical protein [Sphaerisporangium sp. NPDC051011]|uniref:hypothetical protein n=1 Tax=Sphaerisporangium sp. NPDC051011 TaxID=3155792 RepID=UPI0033E9C304
MTGPELTREDFDPADWEELIEAVHPVISAMADITHHRTADGEWHPCAESGNTPELIAEIRALLAQLEAPIKDARTQLARAQRAARLRAVRRAKGGGAG